MTSLWMLAATLTAAPAPSPDWTLDPSHSAAHFSVTHMMVATVQGQFSGVNGKVHLDSSDLAKSSVEATIDATTVNTREPKRDGHLKSPDFFDVAKFPTLTFKSKKVESAGKDRLKVTGDLTMHGVTHEVTLDVTLNEGEHKDGYGNLKRGLTAKTRVNRKDYGLLWNKTLEGGGVLVSDDVSIDLDIELGQPLAPAKG
jgi:polyisoprenoid-binding protein YceI